MHVHSASSGENAAAENFWYPHTPDLMGQLKNVNTALGPRPSSTSLKLNAKLSWNCDPLQVFLSTILCLPPAHIIVQYQFLSHPLCTRGSRYHEEAWPLYWDQPNSSNRLPNNKHVLQKHQEAPLQDPSCHVLTYGQLLLPLGNLAP